MHAGNSRAGIALVERLRPPLLRRRLAAVAFGAAISFGGMSASAAAAEDVSTSIAQLKSLQLEDLLKVEVTTVSKHAEPLLDAPSAVQVISNEDIRRSGAVTLAEALRLAPNLQAAQIDSQNWAISSRGFNASTANKLLVLIDGRSVYTPLFAGVFWDVQNVMLENIDRIEVISGPGATLWGGNAVNGVINVVTKNARDTQGTLISGGGGSFVNGLGAVRYGDKIGKDLYFRVYGFGFDRDSTLLSSGVEATNSWYTTQGGFRADWLPSHGEILTVQGDFYGGTLGQAAPGDVTVNGQNLLGRWTHPFSDESDATLQLYWDRTWRRIPATFSEELNTYDLDFQNRIAFGERNHFIWGAGYRLMLDDVANSAVLAFLPEKKDFQIFSGFVQDEIALIPEHLFLTPGTKLEHNDFSGFEVQPSIRLSWKPEPRQTVWAAISRAVRTPSRIDTDFYVPGNPPYIVRGGGDEFESEKLIAYELGYRIGITPRLTASISSFYNDYDDVRSIEPVPDPVAPNVILNGLNAQTYGAEFSANYKLTDWWALRGGYTWFKKHIDVEFADLSQGRGEGNDPQNQFLIQSMMNLPANLEFDSVLRYVDNLDQLGPTVPSYLSLDLRLAWHPWPDLELAVVGQNLLDDRHPEFGTLPARQEIPRSIYGKVTLKF